jgi:hypothetical protein
MTALQCWSDEVRLLGKNLRCPLSETNEAVSWPQGADPLSENREEGVNVFMLVKTGSQLELPKQINEPAHLNNSLKLHAVYKSSNKY